MSGESDQSSIDSNTRFLLLCIIYIILSSNHICIISYINPIRTAHATKIFIFSKNASICLSVTFFSHFEMCWYICMLWWLLCVFEWCPFWAERRRHEARSWEDPQMYPPNVLKCTRPPTQTYPPIHLNVPTQCTQMYPPTQTLFRLDDQC